MGERLKIGIVGGGPGGLTLARILHRYGVEATVFEREEHAAGRQQGGSLDMHEDSGQYAIEAAGLTAGFREIARYQDQEMRVYDRFGVRRYLDESNEGDRPEVDRGHLRRMLIDSLPESAIMWGRDLVEGRQEGDGTYSLEFRCGVETGFDLVVGADGTWSKVRALVSDARPEYSGVSVVELGIEDADRMHPEVAEIVGHGMMFALGECKALIGHRDANAHVGIYAGMRVDAERAATAGLDFSSVNAAKDGLLAEFAGWSEDLLSMIRESGERIVPRPLYALPVGHRWVNRPGVTLLGDAAHVMSPFGGDGANLAMRDAADLALSLVQGGDCVRL